jgi:hypothetical protein
MNKKNFLLLLLAASFGLTVVNAWGRHDSDTGSESGSECSDSDSESGDEGGSSVEAPSSEEGQRSREKTPPDASRARDKQQNGQGLPPADRGSFDAQQAPLMGKGEEFNRMVEIVGLVRGLFTEKVASEYAQRDGRAQPNAQDFSDAAEVLTAAAFGLNGIFAWNPGLVQRLRRPEETLDDDGVQIEDVHVLKCMRNLLYALATGYHKNEAFKQINDCYGDGRCYTSGDSRVKDGGYAETNWNRYFFWLVCAADDKRSDFCLEGLAMGLLWEIGRAFNTVHGNMVADPLDSDARKFLNISCDNSILYTLAAETRDKLMLFPDTSNTSRRNELMKQPSGWPRPLDLTEGAYDLHKMYSRAFGFTGGNAAGIDLGVQQHPLISHWVSIWNERTRHGLLATPGELAKTTFMMPPEQFLSILQSGNGATLYGFTAMVGGRTGESCSCTIL